MGTVGMATVGLVTSPMMGQVADRYAHERLPVPATVALLESSAATLAGVDDIDAQARAAAFVDAPESTPTSPNGSNGSIGSNESNGTSAGANVETAETTPIEEKRKTVLATGDVQTNSVQAALAANMGDAPLCDTCGHITVRNGSCYRCMNCGDSKGCS